jgi:hypothetical protein
LAHGLSSATCSHTVFQLETHAWSVTQADNKAKIDPHRQVEDSNVYLADLRGLHFRAVLQRLTLLHYDKRRCLSYKQQVEEYELEINHISLQLIYVYVSRWVSAKRFGKTKEGQHWPRHEAWQGKRDLFERALDGVSATRVRSLRILLGEVRRKSKPHMLDVVLSSEKPKEPGNKAAKLKRTCCGKTRNTDLDVDTNRHLETFEAETEGDSPRSPALPHGLTQQDRVRFTSAFLAALNPKEWAIWNEASGVVTPSNYAKALAQLETAIDTDINQSLDYDQMREALFVASGVQYVADSDDWRAVCSMLDPQRAGELELAQWLEGLEEMMSTPQDAVSPT